MPLFDAAYFPRFEMEDNSLATLRTDRSKVTHLFNGYDGTVFVRGCGKLNWHRLAYEEKRMQAAAALAARLPRELSAPGSGTRRRPTAGSDGAA